MKSNEIVREQIIKVVENQLKNNKPPETSLTFNRLTDLGYDKSDSKKLIVQCVAVELFDVLNMENRSIKRDLSKI